MKFVYLTSGGIIGLLLIVVLNTNHKQVENKPLSKVAENKNYDTSEFRSFRGNIFENAKNDSSSSISVLGSIKRKKDDDTLNPRTHHKNKNIEAVENKNGSYSSMEDFYKSNVQNIQRIHIDPTQENYITGQQGTIVYIPKNAFIAYGGKKPEDTVTIRLEEFYNLSDILLKNLTTTCDDEKLETAGMVDIRALDSQNRYLKLKKGIQLGIYVPTDSVREDMCSFKGEKLADGNINWKLNYKPADTLYHGVCLYCSLENISFYDPAIDSGKIEVQLTYTDSGIKTCEISPEIYGKGKLLGADHPAYKEVTSSILRYHNNTKNWIVPTFRKEKVVYIINRKKGWENITSKLKVPVGYMQLTDSRRSLTRNFAKLYPKMIDKSTYDPKYAHEKLFTQMGGNFVDSNRAHYYATSSPTIQKAVQGTYKQKNIAVLAAQNTGYFLLTTATMGLINCDAFVKPDDKKFIPLQHNVPLPQLSKKEKTFLILAKGKTILPPKKNNGEHFFKKITDQTEATCVAYQDQDGRVGFYRKTIVIDSEDAIDISYKTMTYEEFYAELKKMDHKKLQKKLS